MTGIVLRIVAPGVVLFGLSSAAHAANDSLVPAMGHGIALQLCTTCHLVERGQTNPPDHVGGPSFQTVADNEQVTVEMLRKHLSRPSSRRVTALSMPNVNLTRDEQKKLVAYIVSLRAAPAPATPSAAPPPAK